MDLSALSNISQARKKSGHLDQRHEKALRLYLLGCEYLKRTKKTRFTDKDLTKKAIRCFAKAIENNRNDSRSYTKLGYLFLKYKDPVKASKYLNEAVRISPDDTEAKTLLEYSQKVVVKKIKTPGTGALNSIQFKANTKSSPQAQFKALDQLIKDQIQESFQRVNGIKPTLIPITMKQMKSTLKKLEGNFEQINTQLDELEKKIDISVLDREIQKLEINLNLLEDTIKLSHQQIEFKKSMVTLTEEIDEKMSRFEKKLDPMDVYESFLDIAIDKCDELADELEFLEGSGYDIAPLMKYYNRLNTVFEKFDACLS